MRVFGISQLSKVDAEIAHSKWEKMDAKLHLKASQRAEKRKEKTTDL